MSSKEAKSSQDATILVVDPSPITLLGTAGVLDSLGLACYCARDSDAALKVPAQTTLDAVVIDVSDDAEAALELLEKLRQATENAELPGILIASSEWAGLEKRCEAILAARCLFKPIDPNVLGDLVQQSLWMPQVASAHRRRGTRPLRPGWVQL